MNFQYFLLNVKVYFSAYNKEIEDVFAELQNELLTTFASGFGFFLVVLLH